jgi:hypothetical protein
MMMSSGPTAKDRAKAVLASIPGKSDAIWAALLAGGHVADGKLPEVEQAGFAAWVTAVLVPAIGVALEAD